MSGAEGREEEIFRTVIRGRAQSFFRLLRNEIYEKLLTIQYVQYTFVEVAEWAVKRDLDLRDSL